MLVTEESVFGDVSEVGGDAANGKVHFGQLVSGGGILLPIDGDIPFVPVMVFDEFDGLHEHAAGAAAGVVDFAFVGFDHFGDEVDDAFGGVKFAFALAFCQGEFAEEIFVDAAHDVLLLVAESVDVVDGVEQGGEFTHVEVEAGVVVVGQRAFEGGIALFDGEEGGVYFEGDVGLFGVVFEEAPAGDFGEIEYVFHGVEVHHVEVFVFAFGFEFVATFFEFVAGEFEENEAEHDVFVFGWFDGASEFVGGVPERFFDGNNFIFFSHEMVSVC